MNLACAIYECDWYEYDNELKMDLLFMMQNCQNVPMRLSIGPFYDMKLELLLKVNKLMNFR